MKKVIGILFVLVGMATAAYFSLYVLFVGGIIQIVDALALSPVPGDEIAWGICRIVFAGVGVFPAIPLLLIGGVLFSSK